MEATFSKSALRINGKYVRAISVNSFTLAVQTLNRMLYALGYKLTESEGAVLLALVDVMRSSDDNASISFEIVSR